MSAGGAVLLLLAGLALAAAVDDEMLEVMKMLQENCGDETGVDLSLVKQVNDGADLMPDPKLKCYIKCVMETAGMMSEGVFDLEATLALLPEELRARIEDTLRLCGTQPGADHCDTAYRTQLCWQTHNRQHYFLI